MPQCRGAVALSKISVFQGKKLTHVSITQLAASDSVAANDALFVPNSFNLSVSPCAFLQKAV